MISTPLHSKLTIISFTNPSQFTGALYVEVGRIVMYPFLSQFLHFALKLATPCCFQVCTQLFRFISTALGNFWLQEEHCIFSNHVVSGLAVIHSTFQVRAKRTRLKIGISINQIYKFLLNDLEFQQLMVQYLQSIITKKNMMSVIIKLISMFVTFVQHKYKIMFILNHSFFNMNYNRKNIITSPRTIKSYSNQLQSFYPQPKTPKLPNKSQGMDVSPKNYNKTSIYEIPVLSQKSNISGLKFQKDKVKRLHQAIQFQKQVDVNYQIRMKRNNFYLNYEFNPFLKEKDKRSPVSYSKNKSNTSPITKSNKKKKPVNLIEVLQKSSKGINLKQKIHKIEFNALQAARALKRDKQNTAQLLRQNRQRKNQNEMTQKPSTKNKDLIKDLIDITNIQDENFFMKKRDVKQFSLFQVINNPKSLRLRSGVEQLENLKFSFFASLKNSFQTIDNICSRGISTYSRTSCVKSNSTAIPGQFKMKQSDFDFDYKNISFNQLLLISSGQLSSQIAMQIFNTAEGEFQFITKIQEESEQSKEVVYKETQRNESCNITKNYKNNSEDIDYWKRVQQTQAERDQIKITESYLQDLKKALQKQMKFLKYSITSKSVHDKYERQKELILCQQLEHNLDSYVTLKKQENLKKIRTFKWNKNRTQTAKIRTMCHTTREIRSLSKQIKNYMKRKDKQRVRSIQK